MFYKTASRLKSASVSILLSLEGLVLHPGSEDSEEAQSFSNNTGDLEASNEILHMLLSEESIAEEATFLLDTDPVTSLFRYELPKKKPLPPPPPTPTPPPKEPTPPPKPVKEPRKRDYKAERERRKLMLAEQAAESSAILNSAPDFRAPRATRRTKAALDALEAEIAAEASRSSASVVPAEGSSVAGEGTQPDAQPSQPSTPPRAPTLEPKTAASAQVSPSVEKQMSRPRSWRRDHVVLPGQGGVPNIVESVDNHDSFVNFDRGWILPQGIKRHGRPAPESPPRDSPPRKRPRIGKFAHHEFKMIVFIPSS